jgi:hypothetical protein
MARVLRFDGVVLMISPGDSHRPGIHGESRKNVCGGPRRAGIGRAACAVSTVFATCNRVVPQGFTNRLELDGISKNQCLWGIDSEKLFRCSLHCTAHQKIALMIVLISSTRCSSEGCDPSGLRGYADLAYLLEAQCSTLVKDRMPGKARSCGKWTSDEDRPSRVQTSLEDMTWGFARSSNHHTLKCSQSSNLCRLT